jgi:hypothetical protein
MGEDLSGLADRLKACAEATGALVIDGAPDLGETSLAVSAETFERIIAHVRPKLVYLVSSLFNADDDLDPETLGLDPSDLPSVVRALRRRVSRHNGEVRGVAAAVIVDGLVHYVIEHQPWFEAFQEELEALQGDLELARRAADAAAQKAERAALAEPARRLADHPGFNLNRPSVEKRRALAEHLFPEMDSGDVCTVTDMAIELDWLNKAIG